MMQRDDLVKVLRHCGNHDSHDGLYGEAADEIERLRADIREAQKATSDVVEAMRAEIERLKDERSRWWADNKRLSEDNDRQRADMREAQKATSDVGVAMSSVVTAMGAEIERLRAELSKQAIQNASDLYDVNAEVVLLSAEIAQLRADIRKGE